MFFKELLLCLQSKGCTGSHERDESMIEIFIALCENAKHDLFHYEVLAAAYVYTRAKLDKKGS